MNVVEKQQRVSKWWRPVPNGTYAFFIRVGAKPLEFEKGKTAVAVPSLEKLPSVIDALIAAVRGNWISSWQRRASRWAEEAEGFLSALRHERGHWACCSMARFVSASTSEF